MQKHVLNTSRLTPQSDDQPPSHSDTEKMNPEFPWSIYIKIYGLPKTYQPLLEHKCCLKQPMPVETRAIISGFSL